MSFGSVISKQFKHTKKIVTGKADSEDWFSYLHPGVEIPEEPEMRKARDAPVVDDEARRMSQEKEEARRRARMGRVSTLLTENSTLG